MVVLTNIEERSIDDGVLDRNIQKDWSCGTAAMFSVERRQIDPAVDQDQGSSKFEEAASASSTHEGMIRLAVWPASSTDQRDDKEELSPATSDGELDRGTAAHGRDSH